MCLVDKYIDGIKLFQDYDLVVFILWKLSSNIYIQNMIFKVYAMYILWNGFHMNSSHLFIFMLSL